MLQTVALLRERPELFDYWETNVPECGSPGCVIGLIGCLSGVTPGVDIDDAVAKNVLGLNTASQFYELMGQAAAGRGLWHKHANSAADALEKLAAEW